MLWPQLGTLSLWLAPSRSPRIAMNLGDEWRSPGAVEGPQDQMMWSPALFPMGGVILPGSLWASVSTSPEWAHLSTSLIHSVLCGTKAAKHVEMICNVPHIPAHLPRGAVPPWTPARALSCPRGISFQCPWESLEDLMIHSSLHSVFTSPFLPKVSK